MTREEILAMEPGRELDAVVMEMVMKQPIMKRAQLTEWPGRYVYDPEPFHLTPEELYWQSNQQHGEWEIVGPRYSTDIAAAWQVVEDLQGSHLYTDIRTCADFYEVWITNHANNSSTETFASPKLPEAIAKAALLAVLEATP